MKLSLLHRRFFRPARLGAGAGSATLISLLVLGFLAGPASAATPPVAPAAVPPALRPALYQALAKDVGPAYAIKKDGCATLPKSALKACFGKGGVRFAGTQDLALHLAAYGRGTKLAPVAAVQPIIKNNKVSYRYGNLTAWWRVLPMGFEQGFTIAKRPAGRGDLTLALAASHPHTPSPSMGEGRGEGVNSDCQPLRGCPPHPNLLPPGEKEQNAGTIAWGKLRYGKLVVTDAKGKVVPATLKSKGNRILIAVNDAHAAYPLTVDPLVWLYQVVTDGNDDDFNFGTSVALNGTTAVIGSPFGAEGGAAYVFQETDNVWAETQTLAAPDGTADQDFGISVAVDGTTAMIAVIPSTGHPANDYGRVFVFEETNGTWTLTQRLKADDYYAYDGDSFGAAMILDGTTALIGAPGRDFTNGGPDCGAVYVFHYADGAWTQAQELVGSLDNQDSAFGASIALEGTTALIGAPGAGFGPSGFTQGEVYVFDEDAVHGIWSESGLLDDPGTDDGFGTSVALAGTTAVVGAPGNQDRFPPYYDGATYVYSESNGNWARTATLTENNDGYFGSLVALDGQTVLLAGEGGGGHIHVFDESNGTWSETGTLPPGLSLTADGTTVLIGGVGQINASREARFYREAELGLSLSVPQSVGQGQTYVSQTIATNDGTAATPLAVSATIGVPAAATFVSATATQGSCSEGSDPITQSGVVTCNFGPISGNAGTAKASVTFKATGNKDDTIHNSASISNATPPLSASATTVIGNAPPPLDVTLAIEAPPHIKVGSNRYGGTITVTNAASVATPALVVNFTIPPAVATVTDAEILHNGSSRRHCTQESPGTWSCALNPIAANNTYAEIDVDGDVTGQVGDVINFGASVVGASPPITASAATAIVANSPPVAQDSSVSTKENQALNGTLDASDADGDPLTFSIVGQPAHGTVKINDASKGTYTYTPAQDYSGKDSFTFKANDGTADSNVATVSIAIGSNNTPPVAKDASYTTQENTPVSGTLQASDADGDTLTFRVTKPPKYGQVSVDANSGAFTYTPNNNSSGDDAFSFRANDGQADSNDAVISISVKKSGNAGAGATSPWGLGGLLLVLSLAALIRRRH